MTYPLLLTKYAHANEFCIPPNQQNKFLQKYAHKPYLPLYKDKVIRTKKYHYGCQKNSYLQISTDKTRNG